MILKAKGPNGTVEVSTLATTYANAKRLVTSYPRTEDKPWIWCDYCNRSCHIQETCWKLHGKLANWKSTYDRNPSRTSVANEANNNPFSKEQMEYLKKLLKSNLFMVFLQVLWHK